MSIFYVDGKYVEAAEAVLPLNDMAILRGYAVFDYLRTYGGRPFHLEDHLLRLRNSAALLNIACPWSHEYLKEIVGTLLHRNNFSEANIRFLITGGESDDSITPMDRPRLVIMATKLKKFPQEWYMEGVKASTADVTRHVPGSKSTNYIQAILALKRARECGAIESLYVNENDDLLEGTTSNLFLVKDNHLVTPEKEILPGVTRKIVLQLAGKEFFVERGIIKRKDLAKFTEAFLTSSNKEVVPVVQIDNTIFSQRPGRVTQRIIMLFRQYTDSW